VIKLKTYHSVDCGGVFGVASLLEYGSRNAACDEQFGPELTAEGLSRVEGGRNNSEFLEVRARSLLSLSNPQSLAQTCFPTTVNFNLCF
jgi:hypothetical protein